MMTFDNEKSFIKKEAASADLISRFQNVMGSEDVCERYPIYSDDMLTHLGILLFTMSPDDHLPGARISMKEYAESGNICFVERDIRGPILSQYHKLVEYLTPLTWERCSGYVPYAFNDIRRLLAQALSERDYQDQRGIEVSIVFDRIKVTFPKAKEGNPSVRKVFQDLDIIKEDDKPLAANDINDTTSLHIMANEGYIRERVTMMSAWLWNTAKKRQAINHLRDVFRQMPYLEEVANQLIEYTFMLGNEKTARDTLYEYSQFTGRDKSVQPYITMAKLYMRKGSFLDGTTCRNCNTVAERNARKQIQMLPPLKDLNEALTIIRLKKKLGDFQSAHHICRQFHDMYVEEPQFLHEFAQIKIRLADKSARDVGESLRDEAEQLLREAIAIGKIEKQKAWYWFDLGKLGIKNNHDTETINSAFQEAIRLLPRESIFKRTYDSWKQK